MAANETELENTLSTANKKETKGTGTSTEAYKLRMFHLLGEQIQKLLDAG